MGVMTRLAAKQARKRGTKVLYMVHGFHFYRGAPLLNWLLFWPVESIMAAKTDVICTINREDFGRAQRMKCRRAAYIHGVGVDTRRLHPSESPVRLREELGIPEESFLVLSVGELNTNKNQCVILKAIAELNDPSVHLLLCGKGDQRQELEKLAEESGVAGQIHFLGYRRDVVDIYYQSDVFVLASKREGLPLASLEAMYCGLPLLCSDIRGLNDISQNGITGYSCNPDDVHSFAEGIRKLKEDPRLRTQIGDNNRQAVQPFLLEKTQKEVQELIDSMQ